MTSPTPPAREKLPIGGCISELNCLQVRSDANVECVRASQQHLRDYGQMIPRYEALVAALPDTEVCDWIERQRYDAMMDNAGSLAHRRWEAISALVAALRAARGDGK